MEKLLTLGIDPLAMLIYLANTGVLLGTLTYLLYKPILKILDKRRDMIASSIDEAKHLQEVFEKKLAESEENRKKTETELKEELAKLHKYTEEKRAELTAEMEKSRIEMMEKAQKEIEAKKDGLIKDAEKEIKVIMTRIILDIVENKVPEAVIQDSITSSWKHYK